MINDKGLVLRSLIYSNNSIPMIFTNLSGLSLLVEMLISILLFLFRLIDGINECNNCLISQPPFKPQIKIVY